ncbi:cytochrome P450 [Stachybotrys elegans]|uniref:Cytochrome P450 n=1 Tax=Stachybotrys elegans TaxID=80388 RepID=A0A8K0WUP0_9HYPO|nr:cytochrome P450 [Stachybotrys elegans]
MTWNSAPFAPPPGLSYLPSLPRLRFRRLESSTSDAIDAGDDGSSVSGLVTSDEFYPSCGRGYLFRCGLVEAKTLAWVSSSTVMIAILDKVKMASWPAIIVYSASSLALATYLILEPLFLNPLSRIPGPKLFALTKWRLALEDWKGTRTQAIDRLHRQYGPAVRIGPSEVSFNSLSALRTIYGPGSRYGRTYFYRMFDVYGKQNLFTFHSPVEHGQRKKLVSHAYSKTTMLKPPAASMVEDKVHKYMKLIESEPDHVSDVFNTLHYYSLDNITAFLYGKYGSTSAMDGSEAHRALIGDILDPARRRLSWFTVHLPSLTRWLYTRTDLMESLVAPFLPMQKPATYTGIRKFALDVYTSFKNHKQGKETGIEDDGHGSSIMERLWQHHNTQRENGMDDLEIASECADHFLAGIDTTSDTLMFLVWSLSQPRNKVFQEKLRQEVLGIPAESLNERGYPTVEASDKCAYLQAIIKETLRLYAPLPSYEPRSVQVDSEVDGYAIPADTVVGIQPYTLHRNPEVFEDPLTFNPERWLGPQAAEANRWFWAFSSGGRMCIGLHLAMAEMTTLTAAIYRTYQTNLAPAFKQASPGITARFEMFYDERFPTIKEHSCIIKFQSFDGSV